MDNSVRMPATTTPVLRRRRKASVWQKMALALCALIVADVLGAQILKAVLPSWESFRVPSETYNHGFAKMADSVAVWGPFRYRMRTNSLGFKDEANRIVPLESDHRRVVLTGDSFTEGIGHEFGKTFAGILAKELAEDFIPGDMHFNEAGHQLIASEFLKRCDLTRKSNRKD